MKMTRKRLGSMGELTTQVGSAFAGIMVAYAMYQNYFPHELRRLLRHLLRRYTQKFFNFFYPYIRVTFSEYQADGFERSAAFAAIQRYLNSNSTMQAKRLKANVVRGTEAVVLTMAEHEEVTDDYKGIRLWWASNEITPSRQPISFYPREEGKREFRLTFHRRHRDVVTNEYLRHVLDEGKAITVKERRRKLYTNNKTEGGSGYRRSLWSHVTFEHPASFDTLAMEPDKKQEIIDDLINFTKSKEYYAKIGKAWKRGYLLYGPPGTGKSTMIAAMANLLKYDVYDLELTAVKDNTELRKLLIDTASKSVVVIEDIDCSLDLTGQREKNDKKEEADRKESEYKDPVKDKVKKTEEINKTSQVTLSGLLNFIDGLWSACAGERIVVFTTNYVGKLDPALTRRGRMDKHIELSYCSFEAFKVLARNYLDIESHQLFAEVKPLLEETKMTPADVAENLMPKFGGEEEETCLRRLIKALEDVKEEARVKAEDEKKQKQLEAEEEEKKKNKKKNKEEAEEEDKKKNADKSDKGKVKGNGTESNQNVPCEAKENGEAMKEANGVKKNGVATK